MRRSSPLGRDRDCSGDATGPRVREGTGDRSPTLAAVEVRVHGHRPAESVLDCLANGGEDAHEFRVDPGGLHPREVFAEREGQAGAELLVLEGEVNRGGVNEAVFVAEGALGRPGEEDVVVGGVAGYKVPGTLPPCSRLRAAPCFHGTAWYTWGRRRARTACPSTAMRPWHAWQAHDEHIPPRNNHFAQHTRKPSPGNPFCLHNVPGTN